jgi:hypothetical protein
MHSDGSTDGIDLPIRVQGEDGTVEFDGRSVTITRAGGLRGLLLNARRDEQRYGLDHIAGVEVKRPDLNLGWFTLIVAGAVQKPANIRARSHDPLTVTFRAFGGRYQAFLRLRDAILAAKTTPQASSPAAQPSIATELERLAQLHRGGVLSDEEFTAAKNRLLSP